MTTRTKTECELTYDGILVYHVEVSGVYRAAEPSLGLSEGFEGIKVDQLLDIWMVPPGAQSVRWPADFEDGEWINPHQAVGKTESDKLGACQAACDAVRAEIADTFADEIAVELFGAE